jgi:hypothetical protein
MGGGPDERDQSDEEQQRMASKRSTTAVEPFWRWLTVPAAHHERTPRDHCLSMDDRPAIADLVNTPRPKVAA